MSFGSSDSWVILNPIEQAIKAKIEKYGTPLKDWDIQINYGIKTGCNEAFIISTAKRNEILAACKTQEERQRTADIIRPVLRGRDIKRYSYDWAELWIIATFPSRNYDIEDYPALKNYLLSYAKEELIANGKEQISEKFLHDYCKHKLSQTGETITINGRTVKARKKTNNKWFETQDSIGYWDDFNKPKLIYSEIVQSPKFYFDENGNFFNEATAFLLVGKHLKYLVKMFHSRLMAYSFKTFYAGGGLGAEGIRYKKAFLEKLPIILPTEEQEKFFFSEKSEIETEKYVYELYNISKEEQEFIESQYSQ